jgi:hypothetical protein
MHIEWIGSTIAWKVQSLHWHESGGPRQAVLHSTSVPDVQHLSELLGQPLCIYAGQGRPTWWGYVDQVQVTLPPSAKVQLRWQLDEMANRTARLLPVEAPAPFANHWQHTPWQDEWLSQARFGIRERLLPPDSGTPPTWPQMRFAAALKPLGVHLIAKGWVETLHWRTCDPLEMRTEFTQAGGIFHPLQQNLAQAFTVQSTAPVTGLWLRAAARNPPIPLQWALCQDDNAQPGLPLAQGSLAPTEISNTITWRRIPLSTPLLLNAGQPLWLWLSGDASWNLELNEATPCSTGALLQQLPDNSWTTLLPLAQLLFSLETAWDARRLLDRIGSLGGQFLSGWQAETNPTLSFTPPDRFITCGQALNQLCELANAQASITPERVLRLMPRPTGEERILGSDGLVRTQTGRLLSLEESLAGHNLRLLQGNLPVHYCRAASWQAGQATAQPTE